MMDEYDSPKYKLSSLMETLKDISERASRAKGGLLNAITAGADEYDDVGNLSGIKSCLIEIDNQIFEAMCCAMDIYSNTPEWKPEEEESADEEN